MLNTKYRIYPEHEHEFSVRSRGRRLQQLARHPEVFDLVIVGGGIVGAGLAQEAVAAGLKVALVEKGDFASGTSSKSSKLLHGGLRYLEHYEFGLVFEALSARNALFDRFPHLAKKVPFLMPVYKRYEEKAWFINLGCWLYDAFSWLSSPGHTRLHRYINRRKLKALEPRIQQEGFEGGLQFFDAACDDARLVIETLKTAHAAGADVFNYLSVTGFEQRGDRTDTVHVYDHVGEQKLTLSARYVVNATGPWADHLNRLANPEEPSYLRPSKGVHIIIPRVTEIERAVMLKSVPDASGKQRWMFIIPYDAYSLVGTTDTDYEGDKRSDYLDHDNYASSEDVDYLLASVNAVYPESNVSRDDVVSSFGGWRPLVSPPGKSGLHESDLSRDHEIFDTTTGIVMLAGGKLTTYLYMAQDLLSYLRKKDAHLFKGAKTSLQPLCNLHEANSEAELMEQNAFVLQAFPEEWRLRLLQRYGSEVATLAKLLPLFAEGQGLKPVAGLSEDILLLYVELVYSILWEQCVHLNDFMLRRQRVLLKERHQGVKAAKPLAEAMASVLSLLHADSKAEHADWVRTEIAAFEAELARTNAWQSESEVPASSGLSETSAEPVSI